MKTLRIFLTGILTLAAATAYPTHAQVLFRNWHLHMSDIQAKSRVATIKGEERHDAQGGVRVRGILAVREGSEAQPEELFFHIEFTTTLLRRTEYDPEFLRADMAVGYRHRRNDYTIDIYGEHLRRMNTDRVGRRNTNFFGVALADPEFEHRRFGTKSRVHARVGAGGLVNENGFKADARYLAAVRYDLHAMPKGQMFLEGQADVIDAPGGGLTDIEGGIRFLFFPDADNSLSLAVKFYDSKNPLGHGDDGVRVDLDLEGSHAGEIFKQFLGNTAGEFVIGGRGEDIASDLAADFDIVRFRSRGREYMIVLDTLQRAAWGKLNKIEYNLAGGVETTLDDGVILGAHLDHRSTHGLDRAMPEKNYNIVRLSLKTFGWDAGRENETKKRVAGFLSLGNYIENSFKKSRDWDARTGVRVDGKVHSWGSWEVIPYVKGTLRNATHAGRREEVTGEFGVRFNGNAVFARWSQDAYFGEGGLGGVALRF